MREEAERDAIEKALKNSKPSDFVAPQYFGMNTTVMQVNQTGVVANISWIRPFDTGYKDMMVLKHN